MKITKIDKLLHNIRRCECEWETDPCPKCREKTNQLINILQGIVKSKPKSESSGNFSYVDANVNSEERFGDVEF